MSFAILTDLTKCIGCEACASACKEINQLPGPPGEKLSATSWTVVQRKGKINVRRQCMHCVDPTCASVCPVAALRKTKEGPVIYEEARCIGCRYCIMACPFEVPTYEWDKTAPRVQKCIMCYDKRVAQGQQPACTSVCPTGATIFGQRDQLIAVAEERIAKEPGRYVKHIYGLHEAGGTAVLYLSGVPFEALGFKQLRADVAYPRLTWAVLSQLPTVVSVGSVLMCGIWWITNRRMTIERLHATEQQKQPHEEQQ